jgi:hypothetical protein
VEAKTSHPLSIHTTATVCKRYHINLSLVAVATLFLSGRDVAGWLIEKEEKV